LTDQEAGAPGGERRNTSGPRELKPALRAACVVLVLAVLVRLLALSLAPGALFFSDETPNTLPALVYGAPWPNLHLCEYVPGVRGLSTHWLQRSALLLLGFRPASLMVLSIAMGSLAAASMLVLAWMAWGRGVGLMAGGLGVTMPVMLGASLWSDPTSVALFVFLLGLAVLVCALQGDRPTVGRALAAFAGASIAGSTLLARFEYGLLVAFLGLALLQHAYRRWRRDASITLCLAALAGVTVALLYVPVCDRIVYGDFFYFFVDQAMDAEVGDLGFSGERAIGGWLRLIVIGLGGVFPLTLVGTVVLLRRAEVLQVLAPLGLLGFLMLRAYTSLLMAPALRYGLVIVAGGSWPLPSE
jgi:hypothetical protein